jgi:hypothetical protein
MFIKINLAKVTPLAKKKARGRKNRDLGKVSLIH